jgi:hypothetical protein
MGCHSEDFNAINRWRLAELAPSDLLRSLYCDLSEVDEAELVRTKWMWARKPKSFLQDGLSGYLALAFLGVVLLFLPRVGMMLALLCSFATLIVVAKDAVRIGRWRHEYGASMGRLLRSRKKRT